MPFKFKPRISYRPKSSGSGGLSSIIQKRRKTRLKPKRYFFSILRLTDAVSAGVYLDKDLHRSPDHIFPNTKILSLGIFDKKKGGALVGLASGTIHKEGKPIYDPANAHYDVLEKKWKYESIGKVNKGKGDLLNIQTIRVIKPNEVKAFNNLGIKTTRPKTENELMEMADWVGEELDKKTTWPDIKKAALSEFGEGTLRKTLGITEKDPSNYFDIVTDVPVEPDLLERSPGHGPEFYGGSPGRWGRDVLTGIRSIGERIPSAGRMSGVRVTGSHRHTDPFGVAEKGIGGKKGEVALPSRGRDPEATFEDLPSIDHIKNRFKVAPLNEEDRIRIIRATQDLEYEDPF